MDFWKIPSGEITNYPYLVQIAQTGRDIVLSTGMCEMDEIADAMKVLEENGAGNISSPIVIQNTRHHMRM